jgi:PPM family protein phosphatase
VKIVAQGNSDVGRVREGNEDSFLVDSELGLHVVCDGMGGHAAGEVASRLAVDAVRTHVEKSLAELDQLPELRIPTALTDLMKGAVEYANARVHELKDDPARRGAGTTCTALLIRGNTAAMAHVGDTRLYLRRGGRLYQISNDHTFIAEGMRRGMTFEEALTQFGMNMLSRAVGPTERVEVDTLSFELLPGDVLLLCTDGLHGYFHDLAELQEKLEPTNTASARLVALASERGGEDNITALVVEARAEKDATVTESTRASRVTQNLRALGGIELLHELTYSELLQVSNAFRSEEHPADAVVLKAGDASAALYIIASGKVQVERGGKRLAELGPGSHFGEMALLTNRPRSATVRTLEPCRLLVLDRGELYPLFQANAIVAVKFLWSLCVRQSLRLDEASEWLSSSSDKAPDTVVDHSLAELFASPYSQRRS